MNKKKEVLLFFLAILVLGIIFVIIFLFQNQKNSISADSNTLASFSLSPSISQVKNGDYAKIEIIIDGNLISREAIVKLKYDPAVLEIIDQNSAEEGIQIDPGNVYENYYENNVNAETGIIAISAASSYPVIINSPRIFASFYFKVIGEFAATNINFSFEKGKTSESNLFCLSSGKTETQRDCLQGVSNLYIESKEN